MKNISLIEVFENKPFQDVGTFNSIFKLTPILGVSTDTAVEIHELNPGDERRLTVGDNTIFLNINQFSVPKTKRKEQKKQKTLKKVIASQKKQPLPGIFKQLSPAEFKVYEAIKIFKVIEGVEELSNEIALSRRTVFSALKKLHKLKLVFSEKVYTNGKTVIQMHLVQ